MQCEYGTLYNFPVWGRLTYFWTALSNCAFVFIFMLQSPKCVCGGGGGAPKCLMLRFRAGNRSLLFPTMLLFHLVLFSLLISGCGLALGPLSCGPALWGRHTRKELQAPEPGCAPFRQVEICGLYPITDASWAPLKGQALRQEVGVKWGAYQTCPIV
jgi:hypothetical protein